MSEPLLLIPGMMCDARLFLPQIAEFSAQRPVQIASISQGETVEAMARYVLESAPEKFALAGLFLGGIVALEVQRCAPDRVTRLALIDTNSQAEPPAVAASREPQIIGVQAGRLQEVMNEVMCSDYLAQGPKRVEIMALSRDMATALGAEVFVRQSRALQRRPDQQKTLRKIRVPTLVLCGAQDTLTLPRHHEFMADLIPYATLKIIEDAGHLPTLETPQETNAALREWLEVPISKSLTG